MHFKLLLIFAISVLALLLIFGAAMIVSEDGERFEKGGDFDIAQNRQGIT